MAAPSKLHTTGDGFSAGLGLPGEARVGSTALVLRVLKKVPRMEGRVDLKRPVFSVVVTVTGVDEIDPCSVVEEGGVIVVELDGT